jgi:N-hydroxyarylamine O-acetyltransferase
MADAINLDAYLARIGWQGEKAPTYKALAGVLDAHTAHIHFENLDVLLGRPIQLDISGLQSKLVDARRGGYCFEHASLMAAALEALGFEIARHTARVVLFTSAKEAPRSHMFLTVAADGGRFVVDPGFGPFTARSPVPMDGTATPEGHRMTRDGEVWVRHGRRRGAEFNGWVSAMQDDNLVDFEMANYFKSTHPASPFRQWIMASSVTPAGRVSIMNRDVTWTSGGAETETQLSDRRELRALLAEHFGFDLPEAERLRVPAVPGWD